MQARLLTPQYASPEQVMGRPVNTSSDVYSLGGVLYELLTGSCAQDINSTAPEEIERVICLEEPPPPSSVKPGIPADLDNIVMMAMRKDPARRYQSVDHLAEDLHRFLTGRPVAARKDSLSYRAGKFIARHRLMIAAAAVVVASLVGGIVIATIQARRAERRLAQMVELANRSLFDVHTAIERLSGATEARRAIVKTTLEFLENLSKDGGNDDHLRLSLAAAYQRLGDVQGYSDKPNLGDSDGALASYHKATALLEPLRAKHPNDPDVLRQVTDTYQHMGSVLEHKGDIPGTVRAYETALPSAKVLARLMPDDVEANEEQGVFYNDLALALQFSDPERANRYAREHLALIPGLLAKFPGNDDIADSAAVAHATMGVLLLRAGHVEQGLAEERQSAAIREGVAARHPDDVFRRRLLMIAYGHVGDHLGSPFSINMGDFKGAREYFDKCVAIARGIIKADPQDQTARYDLANALLRQGAVEVPKAQIPESLAILREGAALSESLSHSDPSNVRFERTLETTYEYLGTRLRDLGNADEALAEFRRSLAVADTIMAAHPGDVTALSEMVKEAELISGVLIARRDLEGAMTAAQRGFAAAQKYSDGPEHGLRLRYLGNSYLTLAVAYQAQGKWAEARDAATHAQAAWKGAITPAKSHLEQADAILNAAATHLPRK
jgi:tetratricopeptide (TPR) repeat protein